MILLDTDVLIEIIDRESKLGKDLLESLRMENDILSTTSINLEEILYGIYKRTKISELPSNHPIKYFPIINFTKEDADKAAQLEVELELMGKMKPRIDIFIAAVAIRKNCKILTLNLSHFTDIPGLKVMDWKS